MGECVLGLEDACNLREMFCYLFFHIMETYVDPQSSLRQKPADIYLLRANNRITRTSCEICSKLTIKTSE